MRRLTLPDLPHWSLRVEEVSSGVYRVFGRNIDGRTVESQGTDAEEVIRDCVEMARQQSPPNGRLHHGASGSAVDP